MGFGSYDESEQERQQSNDDEDVEGVSAHEHEHEGTVNVESDVSTDALVERLGEIKNEE
ncbi:DUF5786 family protein [Haloferax sp. DFSO60]|uniref:DUF5786 family protein n=1 Tax=Haloferax sp. DFSO60 TaxID=3388652 RepID=UPI00397A8FF7